MNVLIVLLFTGICATSSIISHAEEEMNPCENEPDGYKLPIPGACSDFYICLNKRSIKQTCGTMYFNPKTFGCDLPHAVDCKRTLVVPPTQKVEVEVHMCDGRVNGELVESSENCRDYFVCVGMVAIPKSCGWMHFNAISRKCVDSRNSDCDPEKKIPKSRAIVQYQQMGKGMHVPVLLISRL